MALMKLKDAIKFLSLAASVENNTHKLEKHLKEPKVHLAAMNVFPSKDWLDTAKALLLDLQNDCEELNLLIIETPTGSRNVALFKQGERDLEYARILAKTAYEILHKVPTEEEILGMPNVTGIPMTVPKAAG